MLLGIDFGTKKIGLAVSEQIKSALPLPLKILRYTIFEDLFEQLDKVINDYNVTSFIIGKLPSDKEGDDEKKDKFNKFVKTLTDLYDIPVHFVDEQRSTKAARSLGKEDPDFSEKNDDAVAAQVILESYLNKNGSNQN